MGAVASYMERRLAEELQRRGIVVWYDPARQWATWVSGLIGAGGLPERAEARAVKLGGNDASLVVFAGSYYEVAAAGDALLDENGAARLLIYLPGEPHQEAQSPIRELECIGGDKEPFQRELPLMARSAFQSAGLADSKIDELLNRDGITFEYVDAVSVGDETVSPLSPVFGSSRELEVIPAFLVDLGRRSEAAQRSLLPEIAQLSAKALGLPLKDQVDADAMARELARLLLVAELRSDLEGDSPKEFSQIRMPTSAEQLERIRVICARLRREHADAYEVMADEVERDLGLASAAIEAEKLGHIDTFRFEERRLLEACDRLLSEGDAARALDIVEGRARSFWTSVSAFPDRHAAWKACEALAHLALALDDAVKALESPPADTEGWVQAYSAPDGWHRLDQLFRKSRYRLSRIQDASVLDRAETRVFERYDSVLEQMAAGFVAALHAGEWQIKSVLVQPEIYAKRVATSREPTAYFLVDAMRFEMGADLAGLLEAVGATGARIEPAIAAAPTITDVGMAALLPGAERSFSIAPSAKGVTGVIGGRALVGVKQRMDHAKGEVPGLVEMSMDDLLHELTREKLEKMVRGAPIVIVRSVEIDGAGESLPTGIAQTVMGTVLEDIRKAALRLADAGIRRFVITADHGHLFGQRRGDDMKIAPPEGGQTIDLHRRCWVGRGGSTPTACVRIAAKNLGYVADLDLVTPRGVGVFKAGGDLAFHHGGLSLQELVIPVVSFELKGKARPKKKDGDPVALEGIPREISNRIFSFVIRRTDLGLGALAVRFVAESVQDQRTVGQAIFATGNWNADGHTLTLEAGEKGREPVSVGVQLDDDTVTELRVLVLEVGTDRTLKDTAPIPVRLLV